MHNVCTPFFPLLISGAIVLIVLVVILIVFIVCYVKLKLNRRGSKAEQQWIRQSGEDRIDNGYIEANPINRVSL